MSWGYVIAGVAVVGSALISANASDDSSDSSATATAAAAKSQLEAAKLGAAATTEAAAMSASAIRDSAKIAAKVQWDMYDQAREDNMPWLVAGQKAVRKLSDLVEAGPGEFKESPGYKFRLDQGSKTLLSASSTTGNIQSGRTKKALIEWGQAYASNEYDKFLGQYYQSLTPWQSLAQLGQTTAMGLGQQGVQVGSSIASTQMALGGSLANIYTQSGIAKSSGYINQGNIAANLAIQQANIENQNRTNKANIWGSAITSLGSLAGDYLGKQE